MERIGRYRIIGELGRGAMGLVYHAIDPSIGRPVAIKTIRIRDINDTQQRDKLRTRLFREARSAGVLSHPNIVTIYDMDEDNGLAYIAMAFVNGPTLEKILSTGRPLSGSVMLRILRQTAVALDYAHSKGIVHRDVKPANIMTDEDGAVKITDFGIAKFTAPGKHTETQTILGTPNYMSPEQVQAQGIDGRSDQFSLAVIAYEVLTGERPFVGEAIGQVVYKIVAEEPAAVHRLNGTLTPEIDGVIRRALAKKAEQRFATCADFVGALEKACRTAKGWKTVAANTSALLPTGGHGGSAGEAVTEAPVPNMVAPVYINPKRRSVVVPLLLSFLVLLGLGAAVGHQLGWDADLLRLVEPTMEPPLKVVEAPKPPGLNVARPSPLASGESGVEAPPAVAAPAAVVPPEEGGTVAEPPGEAGTKPVVEKSGVDVQAAPKVVVAGNPGPLQDLWVTSNPPGAKAVLDDRYSQSCPTPCTLRAAAGKHRVMVSLAGFVSESRDITVGSSAADVPLMTLRQVFGSVIVMSNPKGLNLRVDGKLIEQTTPVTLSLPPGEHVLSVERNGLSKKRTFDVRAGSLNPWTVEFQP